MDQIKQRQRQLQEKITASMNISKSIQKSAKAAKKDSELYQKQMAESVKKTQQFIHKVNCHHDQFMKLQKSLSHHRNELVKFQEAVKELNEDLMKFQAKTRKGDFKVAPSNSELKNSLIQHETMTTNFSGKSNVGEEEQKAFKNASKKSKQKSKQLQKPFTDYQSELRKSQLLYESEHKLVQAQKDELKECEKKLRKNQVELTECQNELGLFRAT